MDANHRAEKIVHDIFVSGQQWGQHDWRLAERLIAEALTPDAGVIEQAVNAAAKAFHDAAREKRFLRWETSTEQYRDEICALVRPAVIAALEVALPSQKSRPTPKEGLGDE